MSNEQPDRSAEDAEQHALHQQLPHQPLPARAERGSDRHFLLARRRPREKQVGDVGARDQEDEGHRPEQHEHGASDVADDLLEERHDADRERLVAFVFLPDTRGNHLDVRLRLGHRHARLEARHQVVVLVAAPRHGVGAERERQIDVHADGAADGLHDFTVQHELGTEYTDDRELVLRLARAGDNAVERDALSHDAGIGVERPPPEAVAQDDDRGFPRDVVFG